MLQKKGCLFHFKGFFFASLPTWFLWCQEVQICIKLHSREKETLTILNTVPWSAKSCQLMAAWWHKWLVQLTKSTLSPILLLWQVKQAVSWALEAGYRHIDCAAIYGNEVEIGEALQETLSPGKVKRPHYIRIFIMSVFCYVKQNNNICFIGTHVW